MSKEDKEFERLVRNLEIEEDGKEIAKKINKLLIDDPNSLKLYITRALEEIEQAQETELTRREESVLRVVKDVEKPVSATGLTELVTDEYEEVGEEYRSLHHRSHASSILNDLVNKGLLGKMRYRNKVYYVEPEESLRQWLKDHEVEEEDELSIKKISEDTEMPLQTVKEELKNIDYF